ncbi:MAG: sigma-70 family RNA polymerase sigma factor [Phycisphaerae bacterium]|nr:sigma-70 family RNA polymerase sigma factor [Phycisphaerae bacterium]
MAAAAEQAIAVCAWIAQPAGHAWVPEEADLFVGLHTAAYRAEQHNGNGHVMPEDRLRWRDRYQVIRGYLVERHLGLAYVVVGRYRGYACEHDDLVSEALGSLLHAVERFDPWKGCRFSTYAYTVIARALMNEGRRAVKRRSRFAVLDRAAIEPPDRVDTQTELYVERLQRVLDGNACELSQLEARVLARRFPLDCEPRSTLAAISAAVGLSKERVRQIQNIALRKLREVLVADPVLR